MFNKNPFTTKTAKIISNPTDIVDKTTAIRKNMDTRFDNPTIKYNTSDNSLEKKLNAMRFFKNK